MSNSRQEIGYGAAPEAPPLDPQDARSARRWDARFREDREMARIDLAIAQVDRVLATTRAGTEGFERARKEQRWLQQQKAALEALRAQQGSAA